MRLHSIGKMEFVVRDPLFKREIHVFLNYNHDEFAAVARKRGATDYQDDPVYSKNFAGFAVQLDCEDKPDIWAIVLKNFQWTSYEQGNLIHEIVHVVMKIFAHQHIPFNLDTQEFIARMTGQIFEDIAVQIIRRTKKKKVTSK